MELTARIATIPGIINVVKFIYKESVNKLEHISLFTERKLTKLILDNSFEILYLDFVS